MKQRAVDLLAIVAHPDDAELACGGTLAGAVRRGYRVGVLDLTRGEMGTRGTPETRAREAHAAARALGLHHRENLGLPDSALEPDRATLLGLLLGPTGNLRAPTLRKGRTLIVGFEEETYEKLLK